jgi:hypothetical protein
MARRRDYSGCIQMTALLRPRARQRLTGAFTAIFRAGGSDDSLNRRNDVTVTANLRPPGRIVTETDANFVDNPAEHPKLDANLSA